MSQTILRNLLVICLCLFAASGAIAQEKPLREEFTIDKFEQLFKDNWVITEKNHFRKLQDFEKNPIAGNDGSRATPHIQTVHSVCESYVSDESDKNIKGHSLPSLKCNFRFTDSSMLEVNLYGNKISKKVRQIAASFSNQKQNTAAQKATIAFVASVAPEIFTLDEFGYFRDTLRSFPSVKGSHVRRYGNVIVLPSNPQLRLILNKDSLTLYIIATWPTSGLPGTPYDPEEDANEN